MILGREYSECGFVPAGLSNTPAEMGTLLQGYFCPLLLPIGLRLIEGLEGSHTDIDFDAGSLVVVPTSLPLLAGPGAISLVGADSPAACIGESRGHSPPD